MAKGTSNRSSAHGTPSSLTTLLPPTIIVYPKPIPDPLYGDASLVRALRAQDVHNKLMREVYGRDPRQVIDRRQFRPTPDPGSNVRRSKRLNVDTLGRSIRDQLSPRIRFARPSDIAVCLRRKIRREVLHALNLKPKKHGRGGAPRRRNLWSGIKC